MRVLILYNPVSGRGKACKMAYAIAEQFVKSPCEIEMIATQLGDPRDWLAPKLEGTQDAIIVVGGDGRGRNGIDHSREGDPPPQDPLGTPKPLGPPFRRPIWNI